MNFCNVEIKVEGDFEWGLEPSDFSFHSLFSLLFPLLSSLFSFLFHLLILWEEVVQENCHVLEEVVDLPVG